MNKVFLIGNLTKEPELKRTQTGKSVLSIGLATNEFYSDQQGNKQQITDFHNLVIWDKPAETFAQYTHKGNKVAIVGQIKTRSYQDQQGQTKYITEILVREFEFLTPKQTNQVNQNNQSTHEQMPNNNQNTGNYQSNDIIEVESVPF